MHQTRHCGASFDRAEGFKTLQRVRRAFSSVARYDMGSRLAAVYHSLLPTFRNKLESLERGAEGLLIGRLRSHQLTSGWLESIRSTCLVDLAFGPKRQIILGLHCCVLDTKLGPRYDVTKALVLTRIGQDVSDGKCVAAVISPPRQHTSCSPKVISASAAIANLLHRAHMPWILEHP